MTIAVDLGRKATKQTNTDLNYHQPVAYTDLNFCEPVEYTNLNYHQPVGFGHYDSNLPHQLMNI